MFDHCLMNILLILFHLLNINYLILLLNHLEFWLLLIDILKKNAKEVEVDEEIKNSIGNLTLLDAATNRMYGNSLFCTKRRIIIERIKQGVFVPIATQYIFAKFFDQKGTNRSLWTEEDMNAYHRYVYDVIINYVSNEEDEQ